MNIDGLYRCEICNFDTKYSQNLHAHFRSQKHLVNTGSKIEEFNDENIDETEEPDMDVENSNGDGKPFKCSSCTSTFTQRGNLLRHIATIHEGKKRTDVPNSKVTEESYDIEGNLNLALFIIDISPYIIVIIEWTFKHNYSMVVFSW